MTQASTLENPVRTSARWLLAQPEIARLATINRDAVSTTAAAWVAKGVEAPTWPHHLHLNGATDADLAEYLLLLDGLNFCFWSSSEKWHVDHEGASYSGYYGLSVALRRYFAEYKGDASVMHLASMSYDRFAQVLRGRGELLLLPERFRIVQAMAKTLADRYGESALIFLQSAQGSAKQLVEKTVAELFSFDDSQIYREQHVSFHKRAQILVSDIWGAYNGQGVGQFRDMKYLTAFADYKLPQILFEYGILRLGAGLEATMRAKQLIPLGSPEELALRAGTIEAVELLSAALKSPALLPFQIDWLLWNESKQTPLAIPHHVTLTTSY